MTWDDAFWCQESEAVRGQVPRHTVSNFTSGDDALLAGFMLSITSSELLADFVKLNAAVNMNSDILC